jgi:PspC domain
LVTLGDGTAIEKGGAMEQPQPRKLYRSPADGKLAGVCGGLGEYFNVDMTLARILSCFWRCAAEQGWCST